ncbi:unnamed protein product, partial [Owenia fusiformis]
CFKMATDLIGGSVPPLYREVYEIVSPNQENVDHETFVKILKKSGLPQATLAQIWDAVGSKQGGLTRTGLYKALALTALAQQGKPVNDKILETFSDQELPKPSLGEISDLKSLSIQVRREKMPDLLGYSFTELQNLDNIKVELVPEKKGLILKHIEYEVTSSKFRSTVLRRYSDFVAYQELLLLRFPYRLIPKLPPKKVGPDREFIEARKKSLRRFLSLIARHPVISEDKLHRFFLTFTGSDFQHKLRETFKGQPDEFMTTNLTTKPKDMVPVDTQLQFGNSKQHLRILFDSITKLKEVAERMVLYTQGFASDMLKFGKELSILAADQTPISMWATGNNTTWYHLKKGFKVLSIEYATLSDKSSTQSKREDDAVVERLNLFLDMLSSYRELCDRHEKGVLNDHQRAIAKMGQYKKKKMSATIQGAQESHTVEQLEGRILEQESQIMNMENRNYFSLHCLQMETQLIHANLDLLFTAIESMVFEEAKGHLELSQTWEQIKPIVCQLLPADARNSNNNTSPRMSPLASPTLEKPGITI